MPQIHVEQMGSDQEKFPMLSDETQEPGHIQKEALDGLKPTMGNLSLKKDSSKKWPIGHVATFSEEPAILQQSCAHATFARSMVCPVACVKVAAWMCLHSKLATFPS